MVVWRGSGNPDELRPHTPLPPPPPPALPFGTITSAELHYAVIRGADPTLSCAQMAKLLSVAHAGTVRARDIVSMRIDDEQVFVVRVPDVSTHERILNKKMIKGQDVVIKPDLKLHKTPQYKQLALPFAPSKRSSKSQTGVKRKRQGTGKDKQVSKDKRQGPKPPKTVDSDSSDSQSSSSSSTSSDSDSDSDSSSASSLSSGERDARPRAIARSTVPHPESLPYPTPSSALVPAPAVPAAQPPAELPLSAHDWNTHLGLPGKPLPLAWIGVPPLCKVREFLVVDKIECSEGQSAFKSIAVPLTEAQRQFLAQPNSCIWLGDYVPSEGRLRQWNTFLQIQVAHTVAGQQTNLQFNSVPRSAYIPSENGTCSFGAKTKCPLLINLGKAPAPIWPLGPGKCLSVRVVKDQKNFEALKIPGELTMECLVVALGTALNPDMFLRDQKSVLYTRPYRTACMAEDDELHTMASIYKLKLHDPLSGRRIVHPVRGPACEHLQCFDLKEFLVSCHEQPHRFNWQCPICNDRMSGLCHDEEILKVLHSFSDREVNVDLSLWGTPNYTPAPPEKPKDIDIVVL